MISKVNKRKKSVLITGIAGGIGRAVAAEFKSTGHRVIGIDTVTELDSPDCDHYIKCDLKKYAVDENFANNINKRIRQLSGGKLDALINNGAIQILKENRFLTRKHWCDTLNTNLLAPFFLSQGLSELLSSVHGIIINISSVHATNTRKGFVAYATSKGALSAMTRALSLEFGGEMRIVAIELGATQTTMLQQGNKLIKSISENGPKYNPLGRAATPDEVAKVVSWVASETNIFIHGSCLRIDGAASNALANF